MSFAPGVGSPALGESIGRDGVLTAALGEAARGTPIETLRQRLAPKDLTGEAACRGRSIPQTEHSPTGTCCAIIDDTQASRSTLRPVAEAAPIALARSGRVRATATIILTLRWPVACPQRTARPAYRVRSLHKDGLRICSIASSASPGTERTGRAVRPNNHEASKKTSVLLSRRFRSAFVGLRRPEGRNYTRRLRRVWPGPTCGRQPRKCLKLKRQFSD